MLKSLNSKDINTMNSFTLSNAGGQKAQTIFNLTMNKHDKSPIYNRYDTNKNARNTLRGAYLGIQNFFLRW